MARRVNVKASVSKEEIAQHVTEADMETAPTSGAYVSSDLLFETLVEYKDEKTGLIDADAVCEDLSISKGTLKGRALQLSGEKDIVFKFASMFSDRSHVVVAKTGGIIATPSKFEGFDLDIGAKYKVSGDKKKIIYTLDK